MNTGTKLREIAVVGAVAASSALVPAVANAQEFPNRVVRIVAPYPPGGAIDVLARLMGDGLGRRWSQPVVIENKPGGNAIIGTDYVAKAAPDGYTLLMTSSTHSVMSSLYKNLPFDPIKDFTAVALLATNTSILLVHPSIPAKSVQELIAMAKAQPGKLNYGSSGMGGSGHLAMELFKYKAGVFITHIPYKGASPALQGLLGGQVHMMVGNFIPSLPLVTGGRLRALGVTGTERMTAAPNIPTIAESGIPGFDVRVWLGLLGPGGIPAAVTAKINADAAAVQQMPGAKAQSEKLGFDPEQTTPQKFRELIQDEVVKWGEMVKATNLKVD